MPLIAGAIFNGVSFRSTECLLCRYRSYHLLDIILKKTKMFAEIRHHSLWELPAYHMPTAGNVLRSMGSVDGHSSKKLVQLLHYQQSLFWFLLNFGWVNGHFGMLNFDGLEGAAMEAAQAECILAKIGN